jgi:hypothetical protein
MDNSLIFFPLLWAESLVAALLFIALLLALAARSRYRLVRLYVPLFFGVLLLLPPLVIGCAVFWYQPSPELLNVGYVTSAWAIAFSIGTGVLLTRGFRGSADSDTIQASDWPRMRLAVTTVAISLLVFATYLISLDASFRAQRSPSPEANAIREMAYNRMLQIEFAIVALSLLAWVIGVIFRSKHRSSDGYSPVVVVVVLSGILIGLQLAFVQSIASGVVFPANQRPATARSNSLIGFGLIWVESVSAAIVLVACITAFASHRRSRIGQVDVPMLYTVVTTALASLVSQWMIRLKDLGQVDHPWVPWAVLWTMTYGMGAGTVLIVGGRKSGTTDLPSAANWSRPRLALGTGTAIILLGVTLTNLDATVSSQIAAAQADANARLVQMMQPALADRDNAALEYQQAAEALPTNDQATWLELEDIVWKKKSETWRFLDANSFDARDAKIAAYLKERTAAITFFREASRKNDCRFDHDFSNGFNVLLPEVNTLQEGSFLFVLEGLAEGARGDSLRAESEVASILRMSRHLNEPLLVNVGVAAAIERKAATLLEKLLATPNRSKSAIRDAELARLLGSSADDSRLLWHFRRACKGDEALIVASFTSVPLLENRQGLAPDKAYELVKARLGWASPWLLTTLAYRLTLLSDDLASYRLEMDRLQWFLNSPYSRSHYIASSVDRDRLEPIPNWSGKPPGLIASLALPQNMRLYLRLATEADALHRLMRVAYAITLYRTKLAKDPVNLDALVPEFLTHVPLDPFDGKPLRMKKADKGLILYSVGANLEDDGGVDGKEDQGDIVFRVP